MVTRILLFFSLCISISIQAATQISASVDKNPALLNESITLTINLDARVEAGAIDFTVLKSDFTVMMPSVSQSTRMINGTTTQSTQWKVVLLAKQAGNITIPSFSYQSLSTAPIELTILAANNKTTTSSADKELFLQSEIETQAPYVQQLSYYKLTIYSKDSFQNASLTEPSLEGAIISQVGQDVEGSELVNGIRYRTFSRRYAITPQQSGHFTIQPPVFSGEVLDRESQQYGYYSRTKRITEQAQTIEIEVKPVPDNFPSQTADWLVAGLVTLTEEWSPNVSELTVGEPITRTITLSAVDVADNQLPEITLNFPSSLRLYQEQPQTKSAQRNGHVIAQKTFTTAVVATTDGTVTLPEVSLPWWNSKTNQLAKATLPEKTFKVIPTATTKTPNVDTPALSSQSSNAVPASQNTNYSAPISNWAWTYSTSIIMVLWLLSLAAFYFFWQWRKPMAQIPDSTSIAKFNSHALKQACKNNQPNIAKQELLRWGHRHFDQKVISLSQLNNFITSAELRKEVSQLNAVLYSAKQNANNDVTTNLWSGDALWQKWKQYKPKTPFNKTESGLTSLYPKDI
ncbi:BatD family protein [Rheinheimera sp. WS51]|uniref:BatD family protein n=1 Tax=Rheinheimera sp. WS51 TaxID=3425886 RepID=UPI003D8F22E5